MHIMYSLAQRRQTGQGRDLDAESDATDFVDDVETISLEDRETQTDIEVEAHTNMKVATQTDTKMDAQDDTELSVHTNWGFPGGPMDHTLFTAYVEHVTFKLWQREV